MVGTVDLDMVSSAPAISKPQACPTLCSAHSSRLLGMGPSTWQHSAEAGRVRTGLATSTALLGTLLGQTCFFRGWVPVAAREGRRQGDLC
jgi:hypothetical protein